MARDKDQEAGTDGSAVRPFSLAVAGDVLDDLAARLAQVRWPDEPPGGGWDYGTSLEYLQELVAYWRKGYDWRAQEKEINEFPQFLARCPSGGIDVHFLHVEGRGPSPLPLLLCHGWPGSFWEFHRIIPMLTDPARFGGDPSDAFTVVVPSLPGYGFSFAPGQRRFDVEAMAAVLGELMVDVLGYGRFGAQGGDWGAGVASRVAYEHPAEVAGIHLNLLFTRPPAEPGRDLAPEEVEARAQLEQWMRDGVGYQWIQGTRPQTLAYGLTDSPVGLAGWIVEKFRAWSDCDGDVERRFTKDFLLTNIMIYWVTGSIGSSFWPYYGVRHGPPPLPPGERIPVPAGHARFPKEIIRVPRSWAESVYDIRRWTDMESGGHFAAAEEPEALAGDIRAFFRDLR